MSFVLATNHNKNKQNKIMACKISHVPGTLMAVPDISASFWHSMTFIIIIIILRHRFPDERAFAQSCASDDRDQTKLEFVTFFF